jgi:thiol-disulfide isomerase/thioredoxin
MKRAAAAVVAVALSLGLSACSSDSNSIAAQAKSGSGKSFISGDGTIEQLPVADRGKPLTLSGTTVTGKKWSLSQAAGKVVVLNTWGSWCPPCVDEAPHLQKAWTKLSKQDKPVAFMGINYRESAETAVAFLRSRKITYPSLADDGGQTLLALRGKASVTPTTLVLDEKGRIAARVSGPVSTATLTGLVNTVLRESA